MTLKSSTSLLILICVSCVVIAQTKFNMKALRFQVEFGKHTMRMLDKNYNPSGIQWGTVPYYPIQIFRLDPTGGGSVYLAFKVSYKKHLLIYRHTEYTTPKKDFEMPETGLRGYNVRINSWGYGYKFIDSHFKLSANMEICHRIGGEGYITAWMINGAEIRKYWTVFFYENPWGISPSIDCEYHFTPNLGIGINAAYFLFPFESARLSGKEADLNPTLRDSTRPNKEIFLGTIKLIYNFGLPSFKKKQ